MQNLFFKTQVKIPPYIGEILELLKQVFHLQLLEKTHEKRTPKTFAQSIPF